MAERNVLTFNFWSVVTLIYLVGNLFIGFLPSKYQGDFEILLLLFISTSFFVFSFFFSLYGKHNFKGFLTFCFVLGFIGFHSILWDYYKPLVFFLFYISLFYLYKNKRINVSIISLKPLLFLILLLCYILLFSPSRYSLGTQLRFIGFSSSPTVFAIVIQGVLVLALRFYSKNYLFKLLFIISSFFLVWMTKTRLNLIFFLILPFYGFIDRLNFSKRKFLLWSLVGLLILIYPLYSLFLQFDFFQDIVGFRYGGGADTSFGLRFSLFRIGLGAIYDSSFWELLFGNGAGFSRQLVLLSFEQDILLHNDFLVLIIDFGIIFSVLFVGSLVYLGSYDGYSFLLIFLYFISFYHNMVFHPFLLLLLFFIKYVRSQKN